MNKLPEDLIEHMREQFVGKKISFEGDGGKFIGICDSMGYDPYFESWGFQITISRMPVINVRIKSIELFGS